jgi:hypothetical protein
LSGQVLCRIATVRLGLLLLAALPWSLTGCRPSTQAPADNSRSGDDQVARSEVERGPVRVMVEADPAKARLSDEPTLTLTIDYQQDVTIEKPPFGESMGDFIIRDFREELPRADEDRKIIRQVYTLEPTRTGQLSIWPIRVTFTDTRPDGSGQTYRVETEGLTLEVASVIGSEVPTLAELRPATGPVALPERGYGGTWLVVLLLLAALCAAASWWAWRRTRRRGQVAEKPLSPRELAYLELQRLLEQKLAGQDVKRFYVELTAVVRRFIERTTGILAPEQTTEEFLREISSRETFPPAERARLREFLESADLVKFAAHQPRADDLQQSFQRAQLFVGLELSEVAA